MPVQNPAFDMAQGDDLSLRDLISTAWRGRWIILACVGASLFVGYRQVKQTGEVWRAESRLYVQGQAPSVLGIDGMIASGTRNFANTQAAVLKSSQLLQSVVTRPEVSTSAVFKDTTNRVGYLRQNLAVKVGRDDDVLSVALQSTDVEEACVVVNAVVDEYRRLIGTRSESSAKDRHAILTERRKTFEEEFEKRQQEREDFLEKHSLLALDLDGTGTGTYESEQLNAFRSQLIVAERALAAAKEELAQAKRIEENPDLVFLLGDGARVTSAAAGKTEAPELIRARAELARAEDDLDEHARSRAAALLKVTEEHLSIKNLDRNRAELVARFEDAADKVANLQDVLEKEDASKIGGQLTALREDAAHRVESAKNRVEEEKARVTQQTEVATKAGEFRAQFRRIEFKHTQARDRVDEVVASLRELDLAEVENERAGKMSVEVLDPARPDTATLATSPTRTLAQFLVLGLLAGGALTWLRQMLDRRIRTDDDLGRAIPDSILGVLPAARLRGSDGLAISAWDEHDSLAESARGLRTAIAFAMPLDEGCVLHVTSASKGEGKSTISSLLAIAIAKAGSTVIVVDADLRSPSQNEHFGLPNDIGVATALAGEHDVLDGIQKTEIPTLDVMTTGGIPSAPAEMLISHKFDALLGTLTEAYDRVIVDSPPVLAVSDSRIIATKCEGTLLVARADKTSTDALASARERLASVGARILGCALNATTAKGGYGYGYGYGYGNTYGAENKPTKPNRRPARRDEAQDEAPPSRQPADTYVPEGSAGPFVGADLTPPTPGAALASPKPAPSLTSRRKPQRVQAVTKSRSSKGSRKNGRG